MSRQPIIAVVLALGCVALAAWICPALVGDSAPGSGSAAVEIARHPGNAKAALTLTLDDGLADQHTLALPLLDRLQLPATFFVNTGAVSDDEAAQPKTLTWSQWREVARRGHEIGNHTVTHADLRKLGDDTAAVGREIVDAKRTLEDRLGITVESFAYPFDARIAAAERVVNEHHLAVRGKCDFLGHNGVGGDAALAALDRAVRDGAWKVVCLHAVETGFAPFGRDDLNRYLERAADLRERGKLAVDTLARLSEYARQRDAATLTVTAYDPAARTCAFRVRSPLGATKGDPMLTVVVRHEGGPTLVEVSHADFGRDIRVTW